MKTDEQIIDEVKTLSRKNQEIFFFALGSGIQGAYEVLQRKGKRVGSPGLPAHEGPRTLMTRTQYEGRLYDLIFKDKRK